MGGDENSNLLFSVADGAVTIIIDELPFGLGEAVTRAGASGPDEPEPFALVVWRVAAIAFD